jgi:hypothetical protein
LLKGGRVDWKEYTLDEWKMILRFEEFYKSSNVIIIAAECNIVSTSIGVGGTIDIVCKINGERWLIDTKTSGDIYDNHYVQLATYAMMWNEKYPDERIDRIGCLHLRARTKGPARDGKTMQGLGWKIEEPSESPAELFDIFKHVKVLWHRLNPNERPMNLILPATVELTFIEEKKKEKKVMALPFE